MNRRVCLVRQFLYPYESPLRREAETLHQAGFETHVVCLEGLDGANHPHEEVLNGVNVHRLSLTRKKASLARYLYDYTSFTFLAGLRLTRMHLQQPFAAIQVSTMPDFLVFATLIPKMMGARIVVKMQEPVPELWQTIHDKSPPRILSLVEQAALGYADAAITVTQQMKDLYVSRGADGDKISVILNAPESRFFELSHGMAEGAKDREHFTLICHGAIEERYGHDTMLEAVGLVRSEIPNLRLRITGEGSYADEFLAHRNRLGLEADVEYLGRVSQSRLVEELAAADVGIVAQKTSPYADLVHTNKLFEFIHFGKPVLHSRLKAVEAYFDDDSLCFFEPGDAESLARGMMDLYQHPARRQRLVENSKRAYELYKWERQQQQYLGVYEELLRRLS